MAPAAPRALPLWFPLALIAVLVAWQAADHARAASDPRPAEATRLLVADLRADALLVLDPDTEQVITRIPLPGGAHELLELPDGRIAVSIEQAGALVVVDVATAEAEHIPVGGTPHGLALDHGAPGTPLLLVTDRASAEVRRFEIDGWRELEPIATGRWPHAVALTSDGRIAVAAALDDAIHLGADAIPVSALPETLSVASDGTIATAGAVGGAFHLFDAAGEPQLEVPLGGRPVRVQFSPDDRLVAVALSAAGEVALVDRDGNVSRVPVPGVPDGLAFDPAGTRLYASDVIDGGIAVIDVDDATLISTIEAGTATGAILAR